MIYFGFNLSQIK